MRETKIFKAVLSLDEKNLQKYTSKKKFDKDYVSKQLEEMLDSEHVENLKLAAKYGLIEEDSEIMKAYRFVDAVERKNLEDIQTNSRWKHIRLSAYFKSEEKLESFYDQCNDIIRDAVKNQDRETIYWMFSCSEPLREEIIDMNLRWDVLPLLLNFDDLRYSEKTIEGLGSSLYWEACRAAYPYIEFPERCSAEQRAALRKQQIQQALEQGKSIIKSIKNKNILWEALNLAAKNFNAPAAKILIESGAKAFSSKRIDEFVKYENYEMLLMVMYAGNEITLTNKNIPWPATDHSIIMKKFVEIYEKPESFLNLDLILKDEEIKLFKEAAMYGLLKRHKNLDKLEKTENYEKQTAELVESIKEKCESIEEKAQQIERPEKDLDKQKERENIRNQTIIKAITSLTEGKSL